MNAHQQTDSSPASIWDGVQALAGKAFIESESMVCCTLSSLGAIMARSLGRATAVNPLYADARKEFRNLNPDGWNGPDDQKYVGLNEIAKCFPVKGSVTLACTSPEGDVTLTPESIVGYCVQYTQPTPDPSTSTFTYVRTLLLVVHCPNFFGLTVRD